MKPRNLVASCFLFCVLGSPAEDGPNAVFNPSFELDENQDGIPDGWRTSGRQVIRQTLRAVPNGDGQVAAELACTHFEGSAPDSHVMVCQTGTVGVTKGKYYRLAFRARGEGVAARSIGVALSNTRTWGATGIGVRAPLTPRWRSHEFLVQPTADVPANAGRLQFWFKGTGTLWLDDVEFRETEFKPRWLPEILVDGKRNPIRNSSFECGTTGWGSYSPSIRGWAGNLYRLIGQVDPNTAAHGRSSLKIHLGSDNLPRVYFDYYEPYADAATTVLTANLGWFRVEKGRPYVFSAFMRADRPGVVGVLAVFPAQGRFRSRTLQVGTQWQRVDFAFDAPHEFIHLAAGIDYEESGSAEATLWLDALQLEHGATPTKYAPRAPLEASLQTNRTGNIFSAPEDGIKLVLNAWNDAAAPRRLNGILTITDFFDQVVLSKKLSLSVPPGARTRMLDPLLPGRQGFFRITWRHGDEDLPETQQLRAAVITPYRQRDSLLGMNHAYPADFLLKLAHMAGITWWRDWSVKWQTVEAERGIFDFSVPDTQIDRVLDAGGNVLIVMPFPSAYWSTTADDAEIAEAAQDNAYRKQRMRVAFPAARMEDFQRYVRESIRHYRGRITHYQVFNEPLYTTYALPMRFGFTMDDYTRHVNAFRETASREQPQCTVVAGIGCSPRRDQALEFVRSEAFQATDVLDLHIYENPWAFDVLEEAFRKLDGVLDGRGTRKPIWITEFGCYADDDPSQLPLRVGDSTMQVCARSSEIEAAADMVKWLAMFKAYGVEKVFFHLGMCRPINRSTGGGVFFEYGGTPRKMYAAAAVLSGLLPPGADVLESEQPDPGTKAYRFRRDSGVLTVAWTRTDEEKEIRLRTGVEARDIMGNPIRSPLLTLSPIPVYLISDTPEPAILPR